MKTTSKKKFALLAIAASAVLVLAMTACTHTFKCGICQQEKNEAGHKMTILGQEIEICDSCYNTSKSLIGG